MTGPTAMTLLMLYTTLALALLLLSSGFQLAWFFTLRMDEEDF